MCPTHETQPYQHRPVMVAEVTDLFAPVPPGTVLDATVGGAGHAAALLAAHPHLRVVGIDQDPSAIAAAAAALGPAGDRATLRRANFASLSDVVAELGVAPLSGVLFDLGVSSPQLDRPERGFSHRFDAPLDMRMDPATPRSAADVLNGTSEAGLVRLLRSYGDERHAARIARAIVAHRPIETTGRLADVVRRAVPAPARRRGGHPARRTFQALRIVVNGELDVLPGAIDAAIDLLAPGGRCAVLAYHSGEDRIVKERFRNATTGGCTCPPELPCICQAVPTVRLLKRGAWRPSPEEVAANPRGESARFRAVEKLEILPS